MGFGARLAGTQFTFLSTLGATRGAPHGQRLFLGDFHGYTMRFSAVAKMVSFDQMNSTELFCTVFRKAIRRI
jgi:hypothetical protein